MMLCQNCIVNQLTKLQECMNQHYGDKESLLIEFLRYARNDSQLARDFGFNSTRMHRIMNYGGMSIKEYYQIVSKL